MSVWSDCHQLLSTKSLDFACKFDDPRMSLVEMSIGLLVFELSIISRAVIQRLDSDLIRQIDNLLQSA